VVLTVEPRPVPSLKGSLHREVWEADARAGSETHTSENLVVSSAQLIFQEEVTLEKRKIKRNAKKCLAKMDEDDDLENGIRVEMD
jgi:predicted house-cleaning NTP pyrophosphatase (Maf/HAM1 superfamily)